MTAFKGLGTYGNAVGVVTPGDHKQDNSGLIAKASGNLVRPGLFWGGTASIVSGTANMSYNVAAYTIATTRGATSGTVLGGNDGTFNVATTAAPGSNSRIDVIYHWQREFSIDGVDSNPVIGVVQGTAAASPTVPSLAAFPGAVALAQVLVPTGVTATNTGTTFTHVAPFTAAAGGTIVFRTATEMNAATSMTQGQKGYVLADKTEYTFDGTAWYSLPMCRVTVTTAGITTSGTPATFTAVPFNVETYDTNNMHDNVTNNSRITAPITGYYYIKAKLGYSTGTSDGIQIAVSGTALPETQTYVLFPSGAFADPSVDTTVFLTAGQYVEVLMGSTTAGAAISQSRCYFEMSYVRGA